MQWRNVDTAIFTSTLELRKTDGWMDGWVQSFLMCEVTPEETRKEVGGCVYVSDWAWRALRGRRDE